MLVSLCKMKHGDNFIEILKRFWIQIDTLEIPDRHIMVLCRTTIGSSTCKLLSRRINNENGRMEESCCNSVHYFTDGNGAGSDGIG